MERRTVIMDKPARRGRKRGGNSRGSSQIAASPASQCAVDKPEEVFAERSPVEYLAPLEDSDNDYEFTPRKQKKEKVVAMLSEEEEASMVEWLKSNPIIFNRKLKTYKDINKKEAMWRVKAEEMNVDVVVLKTWYTSLRTRYGRLKKLSSRQDPTELTERDSWILKGFEFLRPHIFEVPKRTMKKKASSNAVPPAKVVPAHDADAALADAHPYPIKPPSVTPLNKLSSTRRSTVSTTRGRRVAASEEEETVLTNLFERSQQFLALQQQLLDQLRPEGDRERDAFVEWLRSAMRNFEHSVWRRCQRELINVMYRFIAENDALRTKDLSHHTSADVLGSQCDERSK